MTDLWMLGLNAAIEAKKIRTKVEYEKMPDKYCVKKVIERHNDYMDKLSGEFDNC